VLGSAETSSEAARWTRSFFDGLRSQEKMEDLEKFSCWLSLLFAGMITGTVAGLLAQREGASCRLYANKLVYHTIGGQTSKQALMQRRRRP